MSKVNSQKLYYLWVQNCGNSYSEHNIRKFNCERQLGLFITKPTQYKPTPHKIIHDNAQARLNRLINLLLRTE